MNNMNNKKKKTMFSVETREDGLGLNIKAQGHPAAIGFMTAIGLVQYFEQEDTALSMEEFILVLKKACEDSEFLSLTVQAVSLYADNNVDGIKAFAMLMAAASVKSTSEGKMKEKDEKGGPVA